MILSLLWIYSRWCPIWTNSGAETLQNMQVNSEIKARAALIKAKTEVLSSDEADHLPSQTSQTRDWGDGDEEPEKVTSCNFFRKGKNQRENVSKDLRLVDLLSLEEEELSNQDTWMLSMVGRLSAAVVLLLFWLFFSTIKQIDDGHHVTIWTFNKKNILCPFIPPEKRPSCSVSAQLLLPLTGSQIGFLKVSFLVSATNNSVTTKVRKYL